ncbi:unnamed protein product [Ilex paraguariensis]|uniref:PB1-like domain-containing protein n=1 Tax=Ilex paraguariensis TaxID=185542 RepID=A0ABC8SPL8_9AQUA
MQINLLNIFTIRLHHGGRLEYLGDRANIGGKVNHIDRCHVDEISLIESDSMLKDTIRLYADEISLGSYEINKFYHRSWHEWRLLENDVQVLDMINWVDEDKVIDIYVDHIKQKSSCNGDMNDSDSSDYDIIDDQLYETFVDKDVDKGKGVDSKKGTTYDVDNDLCAEYYDSENYYVLVVHHRTTRKEDIVKKEGEVSTVNSKSDMVDPQFKLGMCSKQLLSLELQLDNMQ